jgi:hypothetical protein
MKKLILLVGILCSLQTIQAQEIYFSTGKNLTSYDFKSNAQTTNHLHTGIGTFYEMGYVIPLSYEKLNYAIGLSLNGYNATGGDTANSYSWNTEYIGIQNTLLYSFFKNDSFDVAAKAGLGIATLLYGQQEINGTFYDLSSQKEFSGLLIQPGLGFQTTYNISESGYLSLSYNFSKSFNLSNSTDEKLSFNTHQIQFGIHFAIN